MHGSSAPYASKYLSLLSFTITWTSCPTCRFISPQVSADSSVSSLFSPIRTLIRAMDRSGMISMICPVYR